MSTKKLERTVIEGGRANTSERRNSNKEQRATERAYMSKVTKDPLYFDEDILDERKHVGKDFTDKLNPMERWIDAQVGRKWNDVRSEVFKKFDTSTTAGRHITFDHLLRDIVETDSGFDSSGHMASNESNRWSRASYYVDQDGFLQKLSARSRTWYHQKQIEPTVLEAAGKWLAGRMIGEKGGVLYWLASTEGIWQSKWAVEPPEKKSNGFYYSHLGLKYYSSEIGQYKVYWDSVPNGFPCETTRVGLHWEWIGRPAGFKQRGALTQDEVKVFKAWPDRIREEILAYGNARI